MKLIIILFPIIAAALYGLGYALVERAMHSINVATFILLSGLIGVVFAVPLSLFNNEPISFGFLSGKWSTILIIFGSFAAPGLGWILSIYAIKSISPAYVAFAEVSYPLFTLLFLFLVFGVRHFDWHVLLGGAMIMIGSFVMIYGQVKQN